jgi:hypothetical protein
MQSSIAEVIVIEVAGLLARAGAGSGRDRRSYQWLGQEGLLSSESEVSIVDRSAVP